jgi:hypothetical protein
MMPRALSAFWVSVVLLSLAACAGPPEDRGANRLTVGKVQREIEIGMDAASVVEILGSPNIVTTDEKRREVWVYDKVSSDRVDRAGSVGGTLIILGGAYGESSSTSTQRTLTVIIKYDEENRVRDFAYNFSQF